MNNVLNAALKCRTLHGAPGSFMSGGCWDKGTALLLEHAGLPLIETTSSGAMYSCGRPDAAGLAGRDFILDNARSIASATEAPVIADLENGFGDRPDAVAETIRQAGTTGIVGGSIEDATGRPDEPIYSLELAKDRIRAAAEAAANLPFPFTLTARADLYLYGQQNLANAILRAQAFQDAGADVVLVPGLMDPAQLRVLCRCVDIPVAVLVGTSAQKCSRPELEDAGVRRISLAGSLVRVAFTAYFNAARETMESGNFSLVADAIPGKWFNGLFKAASHSCS